MSRRKAKLKLLLIAYICHQLGLLVPKHRKLKQRPKLPVNKYRLKKGRFFNKFSVMMREDPHEFYCCTQLQVDEFELLVSLLKNKLTKRSCISTITVEERLAITLSYLSQGSHMCEIAKSYLRGQATVCGIIKETCNALWEVLQVNYLAPPTPERWNKIKQEFYDRWNIPNCLGIIDGKYIDIHGPKKSGTNFMAICDADYKFICVDIGGHGKLGDKSVFRNSNFGTAILDDSINAPKTDTLPESDKSFPCFFVADETFPLKRNIMRPYPRKNATQDQLTFNYRLSRGHRVIENAFGILASRWRILRKPIIGKPDTVDGVIKATVVLHNFLRTIRKNDAFVNNIVDVDHHYTREVIPGLWRAEGNCFESLLPQGSRNYTHEVMTTRNKLCDYFNSKPGQVPWQYSVE